MNCPNCGLANPDSAKFCSNCGTPFTPAYIPATPQRPGNSVAKNIGLGCLIAIVIVLLFGLSCTRACFRHRRYYRHYGTAVRLHQEPVLPTSVIT